MRHGLWLVALVGCPWVPLDDHRRNNALLGEPDPTDADTDADSDSDTDTDTDADSDTEPACIDDAYEPNGTVLTATEVPSASAPASYFGVLCPADLSPMFQVPLDLYEIEVAPNEVLVADLRSSDATPCNQQTMTLQITDDQAVPFDGAQGSGRCPKLEAGWGPGTYYVWVLDDPDAEVQGYTLHFDLQPCNDLDGDGFLAQACGGPDCSDFQPDRFPGATDIAADGIDQDCDGGDDLASTCGIVSAGSSVNGTLPCGGLETEPVWDRWTVEVLPGEQLSVVAQNDPTGAADLVSLIVDPDGSTHYGLEDDRSQMDDEGDCNATAWTGALTACPAACVEPVAAGTAEIWVAQWPGAGCTVNAAYTLLVYVNGVAVNPTLADDDVELDSP